MRYPAGSGLRLENGARVAVVGAGPAGTLFAHYLLRFARETDLRLSITLYEGRAGAADWACNMSAGVLAHDFVDNLRLAGIDLPESLIQRHITGYLLETPLGTVRLSRPSEEGETMTVFRGPGPRSRSEDDGITNFDRFLLDQVLAQGAQLVPRYVRGIVPPRSRDGLVRIYAGGGEDDGDEVDLVVGACGVNSRFPGQVAALGLGYQPPRSIGSIQAEIDLGSGNVDRTFGDAIAVYMLNLPGVFFAAITPKHRFATVTLVGDEVGDEHLARFLDHPIVRRRLESTGGAPSIVCRCRPRTVESAAVQPYSDRLVMVGDAAASRLYKNGLQSALVTARAAAATAVTHGIGKEDFARHYGRVCANIAHDNVSGRFVFNVYEYIIERFPWAARRVLEVVAAEQAQHPPEQRPTCQVLWHTLSGDKPYAEIRSRLLSPALYVHMLREGMKTR